jgi:DNA-binding transcriptional LysR family regulator
MFEKLPSGYRLTDAGEEVLEFADQMEASSNQLETRVFGRDQSVRGLLRGDAAGYGDTLLNVQMAIALPRTRVRFMARIARFVAAAASDRPSSWTASPPSPAATQGLKNEGQSRR